MHISCTSGLLVLSASKVGKFPALLYCGDFIQIVMVGWNGMPSLAVLPPSVASDGGVLWSQVSEGG